MTGRTPLIAGNWKMFGLQASLDEIGLLREQTDKVGGRVEIVICPPATLISRACEVMRSTPFGLGGQDCHAAAQGAHTGDLSGPMLADAGAKWVILGHSERRRDHGETDAAVRAKIAAAVTAGLTPIVCVGETIEERKAGRAEEVVGAQLAASIPEVMSLGLVVAYEPVWAIGTGLTPTLEEIAAMHGFIRTQLRARHGVAAELTRLLYGGSVKPQNASDIFATADVDGALVGGASLKAVDFAAIILAHPAAR